MVYGNDNDIYKVSDPILTIFREFGFEKFIQNIKFNKTGFILISAKPGFKAACIK